METTPHAMPNSSILPYRGQKPRFGKGVFLAAGAHVIGDVECGDDVSLWFNTVVRGDCHRIRIGARTNVQDGTVVHVTQGTGPTSIGSDVTIGHSAVIHACTIENHCLIGMGSVILDGALIRENSLVAAGSVVTPGKQFPPRSMIMGSPAKVVRELNDAEVEQLRQSVRYYLDYKKNYIEG